MTDEPTVSRAPKRPLDRVARMWQDATAHTFDSWLAANRAAIAAAGLSNGTREEPETGAVAYNERSWQPERSIITPGEVTVGDRVEFTKTITEDDVERFAMASGDTNLIHLDESFAERTRFGERIAHGTLVMGLVSAALARFPGITIYLSQEQQFLRPAELGDKLRAVCEIVEDVGDDTYRVSTKVFNDRDEQLIDGEAIVLIDELPGDPE